MIFFVSFMIILGISLSFIDYRTATTTTFRHLAKTVHLLIKSERKIKVSFFQVDFNENSNCTC